MAEIILNPYASPGENTFDKTNLIHQNEFDKVISMINQALNELDIIERSNDNICQEYDRLNYKYNTITILGSRGSGKTSFLLSILKEVKKDNDIYVMKLIDPTKIEEKGHVFLTILSLLDREVSRYLTECSNNPESKSFQNREKWAAIMKSMAAGLPYLDGIGHGCQDWQDEEFIMDNGLKCVSSAIDLKSNFEKLVRLALRIIGNKKLMIIAFDDIDIDFRKGWLVLETLRKYLNIPQIVTLVSGDIQLLTKGIRKQQWKSFGKALLINEGQQLNRMQEYDDLVSDMESQYLQKVLPTQNWIILSTVSEMILKDESVIKDLKIISKDKNEYTSLITFYFDKLKNIGIFNSYQSNSFVRYLLSLPIRMQLQILIAMQDDVNWNIVNPFMSSLMVKQVEVDLIKSNEWMIVKEILQFLINNKCLDESYQLLPTMIDRQMNDCLFVLGSIFSLHTKDKPYLIFDYILSIGHTKNLLTLMPLTGENNANVADMCSFVNIGLDNVCRNVCCKKEAYIRAALNSRKVRIKNFEGNWGGTIVLPGLAEKQKKDQFYIADRIDSVFSDMSLSYKCIAYMPLMLAEFNRKQRSLPLYSINVLLASICEILRYKNKSEIIKQILSNFSQIKTFVMPEFNYGSENEIFEEYNYDDNYETSIAPDDELDILIEHIERWMNSIDSLKISPYLLGKISTRMFYAFKCLDDIDFSYLGDAMHRRIIAVMNSVLVEEVKERFPDIVVNSNNPISSDKIFINNLKTSSIHSEDLPLSRLFMTCPLLTAYIKKSIELKKTITEFLGKANDYDFNIYDKLQDVKLRFLSVNGIL